MQFSTSTLILFAAVVAGVLAVPSAVEKRGTTPADTYRGRTPQRTSPARYNGPVKATGEQKTYGDAGYGQPEYGAPEKVEAKVEEPCDDEKVEPLVETPLKEEDCEETKPKVEAVKEEDCDEPKVETVKEQTYDDGYKKEGVIPLVETPHKYGEDVTPLVETPHKYPKQEEDSYSKQEEVEPLVETPKEDCEETKVEKKEEYTDTYENVTPLVDTPPKYGQPEGVIPLVETPHKYGEEVSQQEETYGDVPQKEEEEEVSYENIDVQKEKKRRRKRCCRCVCRRRPRRHQRKRYSDVQEVNDIAYPAQPRNVYGTGEEKDAYGSDVKNFEQQQSAY